jgi:WD40 repeat protein
VTPDWDREWVAVAGDQGLAYSPDGRILATSSTSEDPPQQWTNGPADVHLWDVESGRPIATLHGHTDEIMAMDFDPDGARIASTSLDGTARIWDVATGTPLITLRDWVPGHPDQPVFVVDVAFSPDGRTVATTTSEGGRIRLWDAATGALLSTMHDTSGHPVAGNWRVDFSPDGASLAAPSNGTLYVWESATGDVVAQERISGLGDIAFTPDGRRVLVVQNDRLSMWSTRTWAAEGAVDVGGIGGIAASPIGDAAVMLSSDGMLTLWQTDPLQERLVIATGLDGYQGLDTLAFSPDGTRLAVRVGNTMNVYALDVDDLIGLARERLTRGFTEQECRQYLHLDRCPTV